jgi:hypothetical protein
MPKADFKSSKFEEQGRSKANNQAHKSMGSTFLHRAIAAHSHGPNCSVFAKHLPKFGRVFPIFSIHYQGRHGASNEHGVAQGQSDCGLPDSKVYLGISE